MFCKYTHEILFLSWSKAISYGLLGNHIPTTAELGNTSGNVFKNPQVKNSFSG